MRNSPLIVHVIAFRIADCCAFAWWMQGAEKAQSWAVEQMAGALQLPAASAEAWQRTLRFLTLQAFFVLGPKASKVR